jgi:hypothetical protein
MPDLLHTLITHDLDMLKIIAGKWGLPLRNTKQADAAKELASGILAPGEMERIMEEMPGEAHECVLYLSGTGGKLLWSDFVRRFGAIREMGIARRNREAPYITPASAAETLWYDGIVGRAFLKVNDELQEFAYIPEDLLDMIPKDHIDISGRPVASLDQNRLHLIRNADDRILDHLTSYLAVIRSGRNPQVLTSEFKQPSLVECAQLLSCSNLLDVYGNPHPDAVKNFLAKTRGEALSLLFTKWRSSSSYNDLRLVPGLVLEGLWKNDPLKTRQILMERILGLNKTTWWEIDSFIAQVKLMSPDFQRPAGDFDSWMIRSEKTGSNLSGFEHWDQVDGALIRYMIGGPLHWLGFVDLGAPGSSSPPEAFRFSRMADRLTRDQPPDGLAIEAGHITALRNGKLTCPRIVPRAVRYQLARFCDHAGVNDKGYLYQITSKSLKQATDQGLLTDHLITLLTRHSGGALPASLLTALQRWAKDGTQASLKRIVILRVANSEMLMEIRRSPIGRFLGEVMNSTTVLVPATAAEKIIPRLMELGYLCELDEGMLSVQSDKE